MIDVEVGTYTAMGAIEEGLIEAVQRGEAIVEGSYKIDSDGYLKLKQRNFTFTDKNGNLRVGKFADTYQLMKFCEEFHKKICTENLKDIEVI